MRPSTNSSVHWITLAQTRAEAPGERRNRIRPNRTGNFSCEPRASTVERPAENTCSAPSSSTGCNGYSPARRRNRFRKRYPPGRFAFGGGKLANRAKFLAISQVRDRSCSDKTRRYRLGLSFEITGWISVSKLESAKSDSVRSARIEPTTCNDQDVPWSNRLWIANVRSLGS